MEADVRVGQDRLDLGEKALGVVLAKMEQYLPYLAAPEEFLLAGRAGTPPATGRRLSQRRAKA